MKIVLYMFAVMCVAMFSGCASIFSKSQYPVTIRTNVPEAEILVRNADSGMVIGNGRSPLSVTLPASKSFLCPATYQCEARINNVKQYYTITANIDPWFFGNFIIGGILGLAVDGASGAAYKLDEAYHIRFSEYDR